MLDSKLEKIGSRITRGARFQLGRNAAGALRLKLYRGPFGVFVSRYRLDDADLAKLRAFITKNSEARSAKAAKAQAPQT
jgi:hypothetical protein